LSPRKGGQDFSIYLKNQGVRVFHPKIFLERRFNQLPFITAHAMFHFQTALLNAPFFVVAFDSPP